MRPAASRFLLFLLLVLLVGFELGAPGLWEKDEARYIQAAREMRESGEPVLPTLGGEPRLNKPPLLYWLIAGAQELFGENELSGRIPTAIASLLTAILVFLLARGMAGETAGRLAALVYGTSVLPLGMARLAHPDPLLNLFVTAALVVLFMAFRERFVRPGPVLGAWFLMGLGFLSKGPHGILLPLLVISLFLLLSRERHLFRRLRFGRGLPIALAPVLIWGGLVWLRAGTPVLEHWYEETILRFFGGKAYHPEPVWFFVGPFLGGFLPWTLWLPLLVPGRADPGERIQLRFLFTWALTVLVFFSLGRSKATGYILPAYPALAAAMGIALARLSAGRVHGLRVTGALCALLAAGAAILTFLPRPLPLAAVPFTTTLAGMVLTVTLSLVAALALTGRGPVAVRVTLTGASVFILLTAGLLAPAVNRWHSTREAGLAMKEASRDDTRLVNLEGPRAGLLWYTGRPVDDVPKLKHVVAAWEESHFVVYAEERRVEKLKRDGFSPVVLWSLSGSDRVVFTNRVR